MNKEKFIKLNIPPGEEPNIDALTYTGNNTEINPETINYSSKCAKCGFMNDRSDVIKIPDKQTAWYQCRQCGRKYVENFGITLG